MHTRSIHSTRALTALAALLLVAPRAFATFDERFETVSLAKGSFTLGAGKTHSVPLDGWRHVRKVLIQAESFRDAATVEVVANGDIKGTLFIPKSDPPYIVTIGETVRSLEFRHVTGGEARFLDIKVVQSARTTEHDRSDEPRTDRLPVPRDNIGSWLATKTIGQIDILRPHLNLETQYVHYLLPVKSVAGRVYAVATVEGDINRRTLDAMTALVQQIEYAQPLISDLMKGDITFDLAVKFLAIKHELEAQIRRVHHEIEDRLRK